MNGAAEAILEDLLRQAQVTNAHLVNLLKQGASGAGGGGGGGGTASLVKGMGLATIAVTAVAGVFNTLSNIVGYVTNVIGQTASKMVDFGKAAAEGRAQLSDLFRVFDQLPLIGKLFDLFAQIVSYQENLLRSYQDLTKSGASFSGSLYQMRTMAYSAYMTLDEFGRVVKDNSGVFATAIGGVDAGLKTFVAIQKKLVDPNSELGRSLMGLGVTAEQAASVLGTFMSLQGNMSRVNRMSTDQLAAGTAGLIKELDAYAKLTGKSREDQEKAMKQAAFDENLKRFMSSLNADEMTAMQAKLTQAMDQGGKGFHDQVALLAMSGGRILTPLTDAMRDIYVQTGGASLEAAKIHYESAMTQKLGSEESVKSSEKAARLLAQGYNDQLSRMGETTRAVTFALGTFPATMELARNSTRQGAATTEASNKKVSSALERASEQYKGNAAALAAAQQQIKIFGSAIGTSFLTLVGKLQPAITTVANLLLDTFGSAVRALTEGDDSPMNKLGTLITNYFVPAVQGAVKWFKDTFRYLSKSEDGKDFWKRLGIVAESTWYSMKPYIMSAINTVVDFMKPLFERMLEVIGDALNAWVFSLPGGKRILGAEDPAERAKRREKEALERDANSKVDDIQNQLRLAKELENKDSKKIKELEDQLRDALDARNRIMNPGETPRQGAALIPTRASGSLGMTGNLFENWGAGTDVTLHGKEAVVTPEQMGGIVNNSLAVGIETLNMQVAELIRSNKEIADYARRNVDATRSLNGDLFAM